jgi:hypothetical protein
MSGQILNQELDIMLLGQQFLSMSGQAIKPARQHPPVEYMHVAAIPCCSFPRYWLSGLQITMLRSCPLN